MGYLPTKDQDLRMWGSNFTGLISADPARYGIYPGEAATLKGEFDDFSAALAVASDPATRTSVTVAHKDGEKASFVAYARALAMVVKSNRGVSDADKAALGLNVPDPVPTPIPRPTSVPLLSVIGATPGEHTVRYADQNTPATRAKPYGVIQLVLFRAIEATPVTDFARAKFVGAFTKQPFSVTYDPADAGKTATYWGQWNTRTALLGPMSSPVSFTIAF